MVWECPSGSIPHRIWAVIDLFARCYQRQPGLSGWEIRRASLPKHGGVETQDNWTMWAFRFMESEFYALESERHPQGVESHEAIKRKHGLK
jgi:hypothetical protein